MGRIPKIILLMFSSLFFMIFTFYLLLIFEIFGPVPSRSELQKIDNNQASIIFYANGTILGKYFVENRTNVDFDDLPEHLVQTLVVTEDERFWEHKGIDWRSMMRVFYKTILQGDRSAGGGSTLSQQLAKNLFGRKKSGRIYLAFDKLRELIIARRLESIYSKEDIITFYLNTVPFGNNAFGISSASRTYFNTKTVNLSIEESATLVGMLKATTTYNPLLNTEKAESRRNLVLQLMLTKGYIDQASFDSLSAIPLQVRPVVEDFRYGIAPHFKASLLMELDEMLESYKKPDGTAYNVLTDGLRIHTAIDPLMQEYANEAVANHILKLQDNFYHDWGKQRPWLSDTSFIVDMIRRSERYIQAKTEIQNDSLLLEWFSKPTQIKWRNREVVLDTMISPLDSLLLDLETVQCGFLVVDRQGFVKVWVGGRDFLSNQFDHVRARRHIGSTMKPFVYATALQQNMYPCDSYLNERIVYKEYDNYNPKNVDAKYGGWFSFAGALNKSINVIAVDVGVKAGLKNVIKLSHAAGFKGPIIEEPGICLGAFDATLREVVGAYSIFFNRGKALNVEMVTHITDRFGNIILDNRNKNSKPIQVLDTMTADIMNQLLKGVVERGTGSNAKWTYAPYWDLAGKTGTSQNYADGWFVGYSPDLLAASWIGLSSPKIHFRSSVYGQSNITALPVWGEFFRKLDKDPDGLYVEFRKSRFVKPNSTILELLDCYPGNYPEEDEEFDEENGEEDDEGNEQIELEINN
jgi:penicillin-binding protein 1A